ncbi:MAG: hypothetical protein U0P46_07995 [Holophagaceae bacterium]
MRPLGLLPLLLMLVACSKPESTPPVVHQLAGAAATPLNDLNLLHAKIPAPLLAALKAPYAPPADPTCAGLAAEIQLLDAALGDDLDAPKGADPSLAERGRAELDAAAVGAVKSSAEALIPFRGWVRKLTGAERASRQVTKAIAAGIVRRAYLKGLGQAQGCPPPAAPRPPQP